MKNRPVVFTSTFYRKTSSHLRHAARSTALVQPWMDQSETKSETLAETNQRQSCSLSCSEFPKGSQSLTPELLISLLYMRRRALGRERVGRRTWRGRRRTSELNQLMPLDNNLMREGNDAENSRLDVSGIGLWGPFDRTFLDITVCTRMRHDKGIDQV